MGGGAPDDLDGVRAALVKAVEQDALYEPEYRTIWPDGSIHQIASRGRLIRDENGTPIRLNGIIWDITEQKRQKKRCANPKQSCGHYLLPCMTLSW